MNCAWPTVRLGDHLEFITSGSRGWSPYVRESGALFLRIQNVGRNRLDLDDVAYVEPPPGAEAQRTRVRAGDVLLSITADLGRTAVVPANLGPAHINQHLAILRIRNFEPRFVSAFISLGPGRYQLAKLDRVGVKSGLNFDDVRSLQLPLPPLPEQRRIADILDKADAVRRKRKEAIALTEELLRSAFLEMFGDPVTNPKGWPVKSLGTLAETATGGTPSRDDPDNFGGDIPWVKTTEVRDSIVVATEEAITQQGLDGSNCRVFPKGTIVIAMYGQGATRGRTALLGIDAATNQACAAILPSTAVSQSYLWALFRMSYERVRNLGRGGTQPNLNLGMIRGFSVPVPPGRLQTEFDDFVTKLDAMSKRLEESRLESDNLFSSLVHRAFCGELTARTAACADQQQLTLWPPDRRSQGASYSKSRHRHTA